MTIETFAAPGDVEAALIGHLQPLFPLATVTTRRPFGTDWQNPPSTPIIRLQLVSGSAPDSLVLDRWTLSVEVWQASSQDCFATAASVAGHLNQLHGRIGGVLVYEIAAARPQNLPDPLTGTPRYQFTAQGVARLMGV